MVPGSYRAFQARRISFGSFEMLEEDFDRFSHRSYINWDDDDDSDPGSPVVRMDGGSSNANTPLDEDGETVGLISGVSHRRRYPNPSAEFSSINPFSDENCIETDGHVDDVGLNNNDHSDHSSEHVVINTESLSLRRASVQHPATAPHRRLSTGSTRSSLSYTGHWTVNTNGSVYEVPVRSRWSTDARSSTLFNEANPSIISKRIIENKDNGVVNHNHIIYSAPSIMSLNIIMATTGTLTPFSQGYAQYLAEQDDFPTFLAAAQRDSEEAEMLERLQQNSVRRRDQSGKQRKMDKVKKALKKPVKKMFGSSKKM